MSNDRSEHSSDLGLARSIARRLRTRPKITPDRGSVPPRSRYVRFDARRFGVGAATAAAAAADGDEQVIGRWASDNWNRLLDDCLAVCSGRSGFLMDEDGLVVALRGMDDSDVLEVLGARLTVTFQQADRMSHREDGASTICIELDEGWLTGVKFPVEGGGPLVIGLMAELPIAGDAKKEVFDLLARAVAALS